jgi:hypothetical protein
MFNCSWHFLLSQTGGFSIHRGVLQHLGSKNSSAKTLMTSFSFNPVVAVVVVVVVSLLGVIHLAQILPAMENRMVVEVVSPLAVIHSA